jgi:site-specific DNA-methyltransferase (adenine-specific)
VLRVLKPGGHLVVHPGSRTVHRMVCAIEDAGFEIRDGLQWLYGSGFPKSHDVAKGLSKQLAGPDLCEEWQGWGTALGHRRAEYRWVQGKCPTLFPKALMTLASG